MGLIIFLVNIGPTLARDIPSDDRDPTLLMKNKVYDCMIIDPVLEDELQNVVMSLKDSSAGWDSVTSSIIKGAYSEIKHPLKHIINLSFSTGIFPLELKIARVIPLYKSGEKSQFSNYRPVSVLPAMSKIFERLLYQRLLSFVNKHNILYAYQFGFRQLHSPDLALILLVDKISMALEEGDYVLGLFLDFSKAFDTVNHEILFKKLDYYGIQGTSLDLFKSYLTNRYQFVEYNGAQSRKENIVCGVPQGSILGPLLFLLYINDLAHASSKIFSILFADDSNLFLSGKNPNDLIKTMNHEISYVFDWLKINKLSINLKKTHFMIFRKRREKIKLSENLKINNVIINEVQNTKFLGIVIDPYLSFYDHIQYLKGKISRAMGILYKGRKFFSKNTMLTLYNVFIYPYFIYCNEVWGNTYQTYLDPLVKIQKRAIRVISFSDRLAHTDPLFKSMNLLKIKEIYVTSVQLFMYKYHNYKLPPVFYSFFTRNINIHGYRTRQTYKLHAPPLTRSHLCSTCVRNIGVVLYNYFYDYIDLNVSYYVYKKNLKRHILDNDIIRLLDRS